MIIRFRPRSGSYQDVVRRLLIGFQDAQPQPVAALHESAMPVNRCWWCGCVVTTIATKAEKVMIQRRLALLLAVVIFWLQCRENTQPY